MNIETIKFLKAITVAFGANDAVQFEQATWEKIHASIEKAIAELESQESNPIKDGWKLSVADGHSGYGVYAHMEEYPEEGAFLLLPIKELESQEPVAVYGYCPECGAKGVQRERRPNGNDKCANGHTYQSCKATHPPQRTWVGLTDEQIKDLYFDKFSMGELKAFAKAIEAKLKEKNT
jgi:hypothetical protein